MEEEILDSKEASNYLKISRSCLLKMAKENKVPALRIGRAYRFTRASLNKWINDRLGFDAIAEMCRK